MKKNYIAPTTEMMSFGSEGIMDSLNIITGSGSSTINSGDQID